MRGTISAAGPAWDVMVDMFFYREPGGFCAAACRVDVQLSRRPWGGLETGLPAAAAAAGAARPAPRPACGGAGLP